MNNKEMFGKAITVSAGLFVVGLLGWLVSWVVLEKPPWGIFVSMLALLTGMTQGAFIIAVLLRTASAQWGARLYRVAAIIALAFMPFAVLMTLIVLAAQGGLIPWAGETDQHFWYSPVFFIARQIAYLGIFYGLTYRLFRTSQLTGPRGAQVGNHRMQIMGMFAAITFVLGATMFSWDLGMTLNHHYADTIYGAYYIMTSFFGGAALIVLLITYLNRTSRSGFFTALHYRNLGTLVTALTIICFYGWWSQFFPIWYANLPEETNVMYLRIFSRWTIAYAVMMVMVSVVPFIALMFKQVRTTVNGLSSVAVVILIGLWIQQYIYSAAPLIERGKVADLSIISLPNIAMTAGVIGGFLFVLFRLLQRYPNAYTEPADADRSEAEADYLFTQPEGW